MILYQITTNSGVVSVHIDHSVSIEDFTTVFSLALNMGDLFYDKESAEFEYNRRKAKYLLEKYAKEAWEGQGCRPVWKEDTHQFKHYIYRNFNVYGQWCFGNTTAYRTDGTTYFPTQESAMSALKKLGDMEKYLR